jgi:hypothetical protein
MSGPNFPPLLGQGQPVPSAVENPAVFPVPHCQNVATEQLAPPSVRNPYNIPNMTHLPFGQAAAQPNYLLPLPGAFAAALPMADAAASFPFAALPMAPYFQFPNVMPTFPAGTPGLRSLNVSKS